jgi:hypothetical protein
MRPLFRVPARRGARLLPLLSVVLVLVFLAPYAVGAISGARAASPAVSPDQSSVLTGAAYWNGVNVNTAPNPSSAIAWSFTNVATVQFTWVGPLTGSGVSQAFLVILFLGFPAYTKQQVESTALPTGSINMTYDLSEFKWYLQGIFEVHAYLENPAGNSLWSEDFYVRVTQPYDIVVATVGLILLTIAELYLIATVGPRALDKTRKESPPPKESKTPAETPEEEPTTPPSEGT